MAGSDFKNILGMRSGSRVATEYVGNKKWKTQCTCGKEFVIDGADFRRRSYICNHILKERFFKKIDATDICWLWTGCLSKDGYGSFRSNKKIVLAHVFSWELKNGKVQKGKELDHLCRNRACVNPSHLEPVTHAENVRRGILGEVTRKRFEKLRS